MPRTTIPSGIRVKTRSALTGIPIRAADTASPGISQSNTASRLSTERVRRSVISIRVPDIIKVASALAMVVTPSRLVGRCWQMIETNNIAQNSQALFGIGFKRESTTRRLSNPDQKNLDPLRLPLRLLFVERSENGPA